ncbi:hypothetical protein C8F01DRAFT_990540, partial [Mycena amicta]
VLELGIMLHSLIIGLTLALTTGSDFTSLLTAIAFHQLFEGLSLGIQIASLPHAKSKLHHRDWFSITLSLLFALTTPVGLAVGVLAFNAHVESIGEYHFEDALFPECQRPKRKHTSRMQAIRAELTLCPARDLPRHQYIALRLRIALEQSRRSSGFL